MERVEIDIEVEASEASAAAVTREIAVPSPDYDQQA